MAQAEADARAALDLLTTYGIPLGTTFALALLIEALIERDEADAAERALAESGLAPDLRPGLTNNFLTEACAVLDLAQGRTAAGVEGLMEFGRRDELWGGASPLASRWRSRAALGLAALGDVDAARRMAGEDLERARQWGAASGIGVALRAVALLEGGDASIDRLREASRVLEGSPARLEHARTVSDLGAALRRANRRAEARDALREALDLAERCGGRALAARTRTELRAAGGPTSDPEGSGGGAAHGLRATGGRAGCGGPQQPGDRPDAVRHPQDGGDAPRPGVPKARHLGPRRAPARAQRVDQGGESGCSPMRRPRAAPTVVAMRKLVTNTEERSDV